MSASSFGHWVRNALWVASAAGVLQGCGGGGGDGAGGSTGPDRNAALKLDSSNFGAVSPQGLRAAEAPLKLAQQAVIEVSRLARNGSLQMDFLCYSGTTTHYTLLDADGNGVVSAGDSVKVDYARCSVPYLGDADYRGTLTIKLFSVDDAINGAVSGTIDFGAGLVPLDGTQRTWLGTLNFRRTVTLLQDRLEVSASAADDLRRSGVAAGSRTADQFEAYRNPQLVRVLQRDTARASISGSVGFASDPLGGRVDVLIDPPLSAYFDTHADSGSVRIDGALNSRITLRASASGSSRLQAELDSNDDGVADSTAALDWNSLFTGYVFSEQSAPALGFLAPRNDQSLRLLSAPTYNQNQGVDLSAPLRLQFDRPLAAASAIYARLVDSGETLAALYGVRDNAISAVRPVLEADVQILGAVVLVKPRVKLRAGHSYGMLVSSIGDFENPQTVTLRTASGAAEVNLNVQAAGFNSDDMLWAVVSGAGNRSVLMPGLVTTISANLPLATSLPLRYQWVQLGGPSLLLGSPTSANTSVRLANGSAPGIGIAELQLTVTDAIGRSSVAPVQMQVANLAGANRQLYFASGAGDYIGAGQTRAYSEQTGTFFTDTTRGFLTVQYFETGYATNWNLQLSDASGGVPAVGNYAGAVSFGSSTSNVPQMSFSGTGGSCSASSSFRVLDIALDVAGVVQRLAVDFEQQCVPSNTPAPLRGSIRINSSLPIAP